MKELKLPSEKKSKLPGGKKFFAVLAACLVAVMVAGYVAIDKSLTYTRPVEEPPSESRAEQVDKPQQGVVEKPEPVSEPEPSIVVVPLSITTGLEVFSKVFEPSRVMVASPAL